MVKLQDIAGAALVVALCVSGAHGAAYLKLGDIKGEVQESAMRGAWIEVSSVSWGATSADGKHQAWITLGEEDPVAVGLLLPAVQKVRAPAARAEARDKKAGRVTFSETAEGRVTKTYWLENAVISPTADARRVRVSYDCKSWRDALSGDTGSDCARKGKVEAQWKVERGEK